MKREGDEYIDILFPSKSVSEQASEIFDLLLLIRQGDLDIRHVAELDPKLKVGEYCNMLMRFTALAPSVSDALYKLANRDFDGYEEGYESLDSMINLLESMRCEKFVVDFHFLNDTYRTKNKWDMASAHAKQITASFDGFYERIKAAQKDDDPSAKYKTSTLSQYISFFDKENKNRKLVVLAVDDSPDILKAIFSVLRDDYKVIPLSNPTELEGTLTHIIPDLFLLDYQMPVLNGLDLIPIIRSFNEHKDTPIIFLTSEGTIDHKSAAIMLGASDFLVKPLKADVLREIVAQHIIKEGIH